MFMTQSTDSTQETQEKKVDVKKINRKALIIFLGFLIPYTIHLRLAYGNWEFITLLFEGDVVTLAIYGFVSVLALILYGTFIQFRKHF